MATAGEIREWVESTRPRDWYGMCAGLTDRVVATFTRGARQWYDSATDARNASGPLNGDASKCPAGGIHYWSYYGPAWDGSRGDWGHVTIDIYGGGSSTLSATGHAYEYWGVNAGLISVASQSQRAGMRYLGWSRTYGAAAPLTITNGSAAGGGATPFHEEDDMTPEQAADLEAARADARDAKTLANEIREILYGAGLWEIRHLVGTTNQAIYSVADGTPNNWDGLNVVAGKTLAAVVAADARDAARDAALEAAIQAIAAGSGADPAHLADVVASAAAAGAKQSLDAAQFPTADDIAQQVITQQERAHLAALQAEVDRLTGELAKTQAPG